MYEDITIRQFMNASWKGDRSVINEEQLKIAETEYIDTAGLYETESFNKECYIQFLTTRINVVTIGIRLQREFLQEFDVPYSPELKVFHKYGHYPVWENNKEKFLKSLTMIEKMEKVYISQLEIKIKELEDYKKLKDTKEQNQSIKVSRGSFIQTVNSLGKLNYKIYYDTTRLEEMAYMVKAQLEENKKQQ